MVVEANAESIPVVEEVGDNEELSAAIHRRVIAGVVGHAKLVHDEADVNHESGKFLLKN